MFSVLTAFFNESYGGCIKELCQKNGHIKLYEVAKAEDLWLLLDKQDIVCFIFYCDENFINVQEVIAKIRMMKAYTHSPILLFSSKIEYLVSAFIKWKNCEFFLLPFDEERKNTLQDLLYFYEELYRKIHFGNSKFCQIQTTKGMYNLPLQEILFVESTAKKSTVHLKNDSIPLPYPLYQVKEWLTDESFVQTHRSFIVNTNNISYIDKTKEPWGVFFFGSNKEAFVSRSCKKMLPSIFDNLAGTFPPHGIDFPHNQR